MNSIQLIGRYHAKPESFKSENSALNAKIQIRTKANVMTSYSNNDYEVYDVVIWKGMSKEFVSSIELDSIIAIRGRLQIIDNEFAVVAEHIEQIDKY